jgi:carbonic anhydrase
MLANIKPAVAAVREPKDANYRNSRNIEFVDNVATKNVQLTIARIMDESPVLAEMQNNDEIKIIGAIYNINTGAAKFLD